VPLGIDLDQSELGVDLLVRQAKVLLDLLQRRARRVAGHGEQVLCHQGIV
jgi:hypothetical protein